jgi:outer membrane protein, heavy metal efflux system
MQSRSLIMGALLLFSQSTSLYAQTEILRDPNSPPLAGNTSLLPLTLQQALQAAYAGNPGLRAASQAIGIAEGGRLQAGVITNPELALSTEGTDRRSRVETAQITQLIELGGKRSARIAVAEQERLLAVQAVNVRRAMLRADVMAAYLEALTAQERVGLAEAAIEVASRATNAASRRVAAGKISPVEQTRASVAESAVRLDLTQATADLKSAKRKLAILMGSSRAIAQPLQMPAVEFAAVPTMNELEQRLTMSLPLPGRTMSPQLRQAEAQVKRQDALVGMERSARVPDVTVTVGSQRDRERSGSEAVFGISVPLPLFNRNQGNMLSALRRADQARDELGAEQLRVYEEIADAHQRAEVAQLQIDSLKSEMLPAAQQAYDAAVTGFELGKFGFLDVLDTQRALIQARSLYLRALSDRYRAATDIERIAPATNAESTTIFKEHLQ